jgi:mevalonate pyrophosphate decarboxylase
MKFIRKLRSDGLEVYFTLNTGQDLHVICQRKDVFELEKTLKKQKGVKDIIFNYPARGARIIEEHLF